MRGSPHPSRLTACHLFVVVCLPLAGIILEDSLRSAAPSRGRPWANKKGAGGSLRSKNITQRQLCQLRVHRSQASVTYIHIQHIDQLLSFKIFLIISPKSENVNIPEDRDCRGGHWPSVLQMDIAQADEQCSPLQGRLRGV